MQEWNAGLPIAAIQGRVGSSRTLPRIVSRNEMPQTAKGVPKRAKAECWQDQVDCPQWTYQRNDISSTDFLRLNHDVGNRARTSEIRRSCRDLPIGREPGRRVPAFDSL